MGLSNDVVDSSITGPPPELDGDEPDGTRTLFNASLYFLYKIVLFLVAIENEKQNFTTKNDFNSKSLRFK